MWSRPVVCWVVGDLAFWFLNGSVVKVLQLLQHFCDMLRLLYRWFIRLSHVRGAASAAA